MAKDTMKMINAEIDFMKRKKAPKEMIKHEIAEKRTMAKEGYSSGGIVRGAGAAVRGKRFSRAG
jgi:hypothetical protein